MGFLLCDARQEAGGKAAQGTPRYAWRKPLLPSPCPMAELCGLESRPIWGLLPALPCPPLNPNGNVMGTAVIP